MSEPIKVTVSFGVGNSLEVEGTTIGECLQKARAALGCPAEVDVRVDGVTQPLAAPVAPGEVLQVTARAGSKASK